MEFVSEREGKTAKDVRARMEEIMADRGEGLVMKHPDSEYVLNGRNRDWIKVRLSVYRCGGCSLARRDRSSQSIWCVSGGDQSVGALRRCRTTWAGPSTSSSSLATTAPGGARVASPR